MPAARERRCFSSRTATSAIAPVPITQYQDYMGRFRTATPRTATPDRVRDAFSELVLSDRVLDQLGPAINAQRSMFIYGPSGNGKSLMTQRFASCSTGTSRFRTRSRSKDRSFASSIRSRTSGCRARPVEWVIDRVRNRITGGCAAGGRSSSWVAS